MKDFFWCFLSHFFVITMRGVWLVCWLVFSKGGLGTGCSTGEKGLRNQGEKDKNLKCVTQHRHLLETYIIAKLQKQLLLHTIICSFLLKLILVDVIDQQLVFLFTQMMVKQTDCQLKKEINAMVWPELGRLLTTCNPILIPNYMTKILSITLHILRLYYQTTFWILPFMQCVHKRLNKTNK